MNVEFGHDAAGDAGSDAVEGLESTLESDSVSSMHLIYVVLCASCWAVVTYLYEAGLENVITKEIDLCMSVVGTKSATRCREVIYRATYHIERSMVRVTAQSQACQCIWLLCPR